MSILLILLVFEFIKMFIVMFATNALFNFTGCSEVLFIFPLYFILWKILNIIINQFVTIKIEKNE